MRFQGKITRWKDDQGFGFVTRNATGDEAFVHIKAFSSRSRRPVEGDVVTYELAKDERGRPRAVGVEIVAKPRSSKPAAKTLPLGSAIAVLFCCFLLAAEGLGRLPVAVFGVYAGASVLAFGAYAWDKSAARSGRWRTRESTLHFLGLIGGWPGALLAQHAVRHKSRKAAFQVVFWLTVVLNCAVLGWLSGVGGAVFMQSITGR